MYKIRLTLNDGRKFYVKEDWPYTDKQFILKSSIGEGLGYHSELEFRTAWKIFHNPHHYEFKGIKIENPDYKFSDPNYKKFFHVKPEDVTKFELIDDQTLKIKVFNPMDKKKYQIGKTLTFNPDQFNMLKQCRYESCHWTYAGKKWIAFPKTAEDYQKINRIEYYKRGLTSIIFDVFIYRHVPNDLMDRFYSHRKELAFNPTLQKMYLRNDIDDCARFTVLPAKDL